MSACHEVPMRFPTATDARDHLIDAVRDEPARLLRGYRAMGHVFGWQFSAAVVVVMLLLLAAIAYQHGPASLAVGLVACLLVIRAHDLGEQLEGDEEPSEYDTYWNGTQWTPDQQAQIQASSGFNRAMVGCSGIKPTTVERFAVEHFAKRSGKQFDPVAWEAEQIKASSAQPPEQLTGTEILRRRRAEQDSWDRRRHEAALGKSHAPVSL